MSNSYLSDFNIELSELLEELEGTGFPLPSFLAIQTGLVIVDDLLPIEKMDDSETALGICDIEEGGLQLVFHSFSNNKRLVININSGGTLISCITINKYNFLKMINDNLEADLSNLLLWVTEK